MNIILKRNVMSNDFKNIMQSRTDLELYKIITLNYKDYLLEAVQAAKTEFKKRTISEDGIKRLKKQLKFEKRILKGNQKEHLEPFQKLMFFMLFWTIIPWYLAGIYKTSGYDNKYLEAWKAMKNGLITFILVTALIGVWMYISLKTFP